MRQKVSPIYLWGIVIGIINALVLTIFEFLVNDGSQWLWNDLAKSDVYRWRVIILAVVFGVIYAAILRITRQPQLPPIQTDLLEDRAPKVPPTLGSIGIIAVIGLASLLAGASLGPEASLVAISTNLGIWLALKRRFSKAETGTLAGASVSALLVAFLGSVLMALPVLLEIWTSSKKTDVRSKVSASIVVILASGASFGTLWVFDHSVVGWGAISIDAHFAWVDIPLALAVGCIAAWFGWMLKRFILALSGVTRSLATHLHWSLSAGLFGLLLGILYFIGGESVQFSGSAGSHIMLHDAGQYGFWSLIVILLAKLLATSWSLAAGYRGGLVFPSLYGGIVIFLIAHSLFPATGPGVMIGSIAGILGAMTNPVIGGIFVAAILPWQLWGIALVGIIGAIIGNKIIAKFTHAPEKS